jgi:hypothetical protein
MTALAGWESFYVIVGSSAGALIGLQFVVITLIANRPIVRGQAEAGAAFATPTIVHFGAALLLAGIQTAPWRGVGAAVVLWCLLSLSPDCVRNHRGSPDASSVDIRACV